jgi:hypothetical protein
VFNPVLIRGARLRLGAYLAAIALLFQVVHIIQLQVTIVYLGYRPCAGSLEQILVTIAMVIAAVCLVSHEISRLSDFCPPFLQRNRPDVLRRVYPGDRYGRWHPAPDPFPKDADPGDYGARTPRVVIENPNGVGLTARRGILRGGGTGGAAFSRRAG